MGGWLLPYAVWQLLDRPHRQRELVGTLAWYTFELPAIAASRRCADR